MPPTGVVEVSTAGHPVPRTERVGTLDQCENDRPGGLLNSTRRHHDAGLPTVPYLTVQYRIWPLVPSVPYGTENVPFFENT